MQSILKDKRVRIAGALDTGISEAGITPRRLPLWAWRQIVDPGFHFMVASASGVRLAFSTDSDVIKLDAQLTGIEFPGLTAPSPRFDLVADDDLTASEPAGSSAMWLMKLQVDGTVDSEYRAAPPTTVTFSDLPRTMKTVEIWLPQNRRVGLRDLRIATGASIAASPPKPVRWVHYGSSISHCSEADRPTNIWPAVAARLAGVELMNFGFGGQCQLDQVVARTIRDLPVDVISAKIGINIVNADSLRERTFVPVLHGFLDTIRDGHPRAPLLVVTPILFPAGESHPGPTSMLDGMTTVVPRPPALSFGALSIGRIRELIEIVVTQRKEAGDANLHLLDGRELFGEGDLADLPDGLHPNAAGYVRMGERFFARAFGEGGPFATAARRPGRLASLRSRLGR